MAGQKFITPPVTARNLSSHIPETPKPMIRAITAARMIMTVVMLWGKKERTTLPHSPPPFTPCTYSVRLQSQRQEGGRGEVGKPQT